MNPCRHRRGKTGPDRAFRSLCRIEKPEDRAVPTTVQIAEQLWIMDGPIVQWFMPLPTRMTIARLSRGELLIHSPIELTSEVRIAVEAIGRPRHIVSPNKLHHLFWGDWQKAYNEAQSFAPPGLRSKRPDLSFGGDLAQSPLSGWAQQIDQLVFTGSPLLEEMLLFHRESRTAIFGELIENFDPRTLSSFQRLLARLGGVIAPRGKAPLDYRLSFLMHHTEARRHLERIIGWTRQQVIMCHGLPVYRDALPFIESAFSWLRPPGIPTAPEAVGVNQSGIER